MGRVPLHGRERDYWLRKAFSVVSQTRVLLWVSLVVHSSFGCSSQLKENHFP